MKFIICLTILNLCLITYQDFKDRAVLWILFPALAVLSFYLHLCLCNSMRSLCEEALLNNIFLFTQFLLAFSFLFIRNKLRKLAISSKIGLGDILFSMAISFLLPATQFIVFYLGSLLFSLVLYLLLIRKSLSSNSETIPLAGLQAIFLILWILISFVEPAYLTGVNWHLL